MLYVTVYFYAIHSTDADTTTLLCNVSRCESIFLNIDVPVVGYLFTRVYAEILQFQSIILHRFDISYCALKKATA